MSSDRRRILYRLQACPYCERVARQLQAYDLAYESRFVEPAHSRRNVVKRVAGVRTVPVLVDEHTGVTMAESGNIVEYLEATYGDEVATSDEDEADDADTSSDDGRGFDVVELGPADAPQSGEHAPSFTRPLVTNEYWENRSLESLLEDGPLVLVFTSMIGSFVARYVWSELADREWHNGERQVVGVTASDPYAVSAFADEHELPFRLFADPANDVADAYGLAHELDGMAGVSEPRVAVLAIDADQTVEHAWVATEWPEFPPYDDLEGDLGL